MNAAARIVRRLLEDEEDELSPEQLAHDAAASAAREREPWEIREIEPHFFSRASNRAHGTRKTSFLKGNFVLVKNTREVSGQVSGHGFGLPSAIRLDTSYVVYRLAHRAGEGHYLKYLGSFRARDMAMAFVQSVRKNPELTEQEFKKSLGIPEL